MPFSTPLINTVVIQIDPVSGPGLITLNIQKLREAEAVFLARFPLGFEDPDPWMEKIRKRHNIDKLHEFTRTNLTDITFSQPHKFSEVLITIISRSSMVSRFEKPPFRRFIDSLDSKDRRKLAEAFRKRLVGRKKHEGFEEIVSLFARYKLARWSLVSAVPFYYSPTKEAFVKPTTAKKLVAGLEIEDLHYHARPDWAFYTGYRKMILDIRKIIDPGLTSNNAAVTGFLMSSM